MGQEGAPLAAEIERGELDAARRTRQTLILPRCTPCSDLMNRFRLGRRKSSFCLVSRGVLLTAAGTSFACQGEVQGGLSFSAGSGTGADAAAPTSVENPRSESSISPTLTSLATSSSTTSAPSVPVSNTSATLPPFPTSSAPGTSSSSTWPTTSASTESSNTSSDEVTEASSGANTTESSADSTSEPVTGEFDIEVKFLASAESSSPEVQASFLRAEAFWESIIVGDLPDITVRGAQPCVQDDGAVVEGLVDDLVIFVATKAIDGVDGILGAAGPCLSHSSRENLPLAGYMQFDSADLQRYSDEGRLDEIIAHEMGHVLGFGGLLWGYPQQVIGGEPFLVDPAEAGAGGPVLPDTHFIGPNAIAAFDAAGGNNYAGAKVPVENTGGEGTVNGHWREDVMGNELMTSFMTNRDGILSAITIAALEDMGYQVDYSAAQDYAWPPPDERGPFLKADGTELSDVNFGNDVLQIPVRNVDEL